jgi:hypothetical protein
MQIVEHKNTGVDVFGALQGIVDQLFAYRRITFNFLPGKLCAP